MSYATSEQLGAYLSDDQETPGPVPEDAARLLVRASELISDHTITAVYDTDDSGVATDTAVAAALRDATCAQVECWLTGDEEDDILGPVEGLALAGLQVQFGAGENRATPMYLGPRAYRILNNAGLCRSAVQS